MTENSRHSLNMFLDYTMKNWFWILCEVVFGVILVLTVNAVWLLIMAGVAYLIFICVGCFDQDKHCHICGAKARRRLR